MKKMTRRSFAKTLTTAGASAIATFQALAANDVTQRVARSGIRGDLMHPALEPRGVEAMALPDPGRAQLRPSRQKTSLADRLARGDTESAKPPDFQRALEKVFGDAVRLDPEMRRKVLAGKPGERFYVDKNGDGKPEEVWFIDIDPRHRPQFCPLLVKVIDEDGDLKMGGEPDKHGDLYVADWNADGKVDAVIEYKDLDGDKNLHEMAMYFNAVYKSGNLSALWSRDVGHDHRLWYDEGYIYEQKYTQYRTHFGGDEEFCMFYLDESKMEWVPYFEDPFVFYDRDRDGVTEEVIRVEADDGVIRSVRHSFDADNRGTLEDPRRYDVSLSAFAPPNLRFSQNYGERISLRGIPSRPFLKYDLIPYFLAPVIWKGMELTWNENDHNVDAQGGYSPDRQERWEGVINHGSPDFPQLGGPSCGPFNKRFEVVEKPTEPASLYYLPADHRLHLAHASPAWMEIDADMDYQSEMRYDLLDTDGDGIIDTWKIALKDGGSDTWRCNSPKVTKVRWDWYDVNAAWEPVIREVPPQLFALDQRLEEAIRSRDQAAPEDPVFRLVRLNFQSPNIPADVAKKFISSDATLRFYLDVIKDRLIIALKHRHDRAEFWNALNDARSEGDYNSMRNILEREFKLSSALESYSEWTTKHREAMEPPRVGWAQDWLPPNIGWESEKAAYRTYWGQFDVFGKKFFGQGNPRLIYAEIGKADYHRETDWGMDVLHVGNSAGLGGVTLYIDGKACPVRNPAGKGSLVFEKRLVSLDKRRVTIELLAKGVGPAEKPYKVRFHCSALAGRPDSPFEILVEGGEPTDKLEMGIGLTKLPEEALLLDTEAGVLGSWGFQSPTIGTIGLGIIYPAERFLRFVDLPDENQVVVRIERGVPLMYHIQSDWLRGRRFPVAPSASDWLNDLRKTAATIRRSERRTG